MKCGILTYKCRQCGSTEQSIHIPDVLVALSAVVVDGRTPRAWGVTVGITSLHTCSPGVFGITDLIGGKEDP